MRKLKKVKKSNGQMLAINEVWIAFYLDILDMLKDGYLYLILLFYFIIDFREEPNDHQELRDLVALSEPNWVPQHVQGVP